MHASTRTYEDVFSEREGVRQKTREEKKEESKGEIEGKRKKD